MSHDLRMSTSPSQEETVDDEEHGGFEEPAERAREPEVSRLDTLLRIGLTLLFLLVIGVVETVLAVVVIFELLVALGTESPPSARVRDFANRVVTYYYRLGRYLTYNESRVPFPFDPFPEPLEPDAWDPRDSEAKALGVRGSTRRSG